MKVVVAPNAFKGCLSAGEAATAMADGVAKAVPDAEIVRVPVADGGDGLVDVVLEALAARARARNIPCLAIAGSVGENLGDLHAIGIDAVFSLCPGPVSLQQAMTRGRHFLTRATEQAARGFLSGRGG